MKISQQGSMPLSDGSRPKIRCPNAALCARSQAGSFSAGLSAFGGHLLGPAMSGLAGAAGVPSGVMKGLNLLGAGNTVRKGLGAIGDARRGNPDPAVL